MAYLKRSLTINGHPTSVSLEQEFWDVLHTISAREGMSIAKLIQRLDDQRAQDTGPTLQNLSGRLRVFILNYVVALSSLDAPVTTAEKSQNHPD